MVFGYLLFGAAVYFAYKYNPSSPAVFRSFLERQRDKNEKPSRNFISRLIAPLHRPNIPPFTIADYSLFSLATLKDPSGTTFLGIFGTWWPLGTATTTSSFATVDDGSSETLVDEDRAEQEHRKAVSAKGRRDYASAAAAYYNAAKLFERAASASRVVGDGDHQRFQAANSYEDASKCYNMVKEFGKGANCCEAAAKLFRSGNYLLRAASVYKSLGDLYRKDDSPTSPLLSSAIPASNSSAPKSLRDLDKAQKMYQEAAELFEAEGSMSRHLDCLEQIALLHAETGRYTSAIATYDRVVTNVDMQHKIPGLLFRALLCCIALGDWVEVEKQLGSATESYPGLFGNSREYRFLNGLTDAVRCADLQRYAERCKEYDDMTTLEPWMVRVLLDQRRKLEEDTVDDLR